MNKDQMFQNWRTVIPQLDTVLQQLQKRPILAVGFGIYARIIPAFFLDRQRYAIYTVRDSSDGDIFGQYANIYCHEKLFPEHAKKVRSTNYLLNGTQFLGFLKKQPEMPLLMTYHSTHAQTEIFNKHGLDWIGNEMDTFEDVLTKSNFRAVLDALDLPRMQRWQAQREEFLALSFEEVHGKWNSGVVVQRGDTYFGDAEFSTYFIHTADDWNAAQASLARDPHWTVLQVSPYIQGDSLSMLGCVTAQGILTSTLQLQLVDVPEALYNIPAGGEFCGHDWGLANWGPHIDMQAQKTTEAIGAYLASRGYRGMFGIDFQYSKTQDALYPLECNPRFTGAIPAYSAMILGQEQVPPIEFFHLLSQLDIAVPFNFDAVNAGWKQRLPVSHIGIAPKGARVMTMNLRAGIHTFDYETDTLTFARPGGFSWECGPNEFVICDSVPRKGQINQQEVPRLFKCVFPYSIAVGTKQVNPQAAQLLRWIGDQLRKDQPAE